MMLNRLTLLMHLSALTLLAIIVCAALFQLIGKVLELAHG